MFDFKELEEFIKVDEGKKQFNDFVKKLGFETPEDIKGLKTKNSDLIASQKKLKGDIDELQKKLDDIDIDEYIELKNKSKGSKGDNDDLSKLQREFKKLQEDFESTEKSRSGLETELNKTLTINALNSAFDEFKIDPVHRNILRDAFLGKTKIEVDGDKRKVLIDDGDGLGLETNEYFKKWVESDKGKTYLYVPDNRGAGADHLKGGGNGKTMKRSQFDSLPEEEKMTLSVEGIKLTD